MNKRGLALIYTTLIFLAVAVGLGIAIMIISENTESAIICDYDIKLKFLEIAGEKEICTKNGQLQFTIENGVDVEVEKINILLDSETQHQLEVKMSKGGIYTGTLDTTATEIVITPIIIENGAELTCTKETLTAKDIVDCLT